MIKGSAGQYTSYRAVKDMEVSNYQISTHSYDYLTGAYNEQDTFVSDYSQNDYQKEYDAVKTDVIVETVFLGISLLFIASTTAMCAAPVFLAKIPIYCVMLAIAWISFAGQITMMALNVDRKLIPLDKFTDSTNNIKKSQELRTFNNELQKSKEDNHLCRYDKKTHGIKKDDYEKGYHNFMDKSDFFKDVLPTMEYYQNINELKSYQDLYDNINANHVDPQSYQKEMHV